MGSSASRQWQNVYGKLNCTANERNIGCVESYIVGRPLPQRFETRQHPGKRQTDSAWR